ncbi:ALP1-like protein [Tanacetum coccineum]
MARSPISSRQRNVLRMVEIMNSLVSVFNVVFMTWFRLTLLRINIERPLIKSNEQKWLERMIWLNRLTKESDIVCISQLRMDRSTFVTLCEMVRDIGGLKGTKNMTLEEIVALFLYVLAHHKKNRTISLLFLRSGETISRQFNRCLLAILKLHGELLQKPQPITEDCDSDRWRSFKGCLGALDGTSIRVTPPSNQKPRYQTRKSNIATNVLGVCCPNMQFIYVLPGWEGSAHDGRVLRDSISREDGLKIPQGCYYLVDAGYCNAPRFLAPFRGERYHLNEFHGQQPRSAEEYFNMKHSKARNVIERCFGLLKGRWKILASPSFFPIGTQVRIILACCLLHNLIRKYMSVDPLEVEQAEEDEIEDGEPLGDDDYLAHINPTNEWSNFRNDLAHQMFNSWREG